MMQNDLNRNVARAIAETVSEISHRGFGPLTPLMADANDEPAELDWDDVHAEQNLALFSQPEPLFAVA